MAPCETAMVVSYGLSIVTVALDEPENQISLTVCLSDGAG